MEEEKKREKERSSKIYSCGILLAILLVFLVVGVLKCSSAGTTFKQSKSQVSTEHRCCSHNLGWHVCKHLLPFQQFSMVGIFVWMLTKPSPALGLKLAPSCCAVCTYLKFHCGGLTSWGQCFEICNCILYVLVPPRGSHTVSGTFPQFTGCPQG